MYLENSKIIVVKIGSSLLIDDNKKIRNKWLSEFAKDIKEQIIKAGEKAVIQLIKVAKEDIIKYDKDDELAADRLKNAAATKKLAIFDAFEILTRIEDEKQLLEGVDINKNNTPKGFAESRSK